jgi:hypothetical protein
MHLVSPPTLAERLLRAGLNRIWTQFPMDVSMALRLYATLARVEWRAVPTRAPLLPPTPKQTTLPLRMHMQGAEDMLFPSSGMRVLSAFVHFAGMVTNMVA